MPHGSAALAQPVEHIIRNDGVACSNHASGTTVPNQTASHTRGNGPDGGHEFMSGAYDPGAIANPMPDETDRRRFGITNLKLRELLCLAHGISLTRTKRPLVFRVLRGLSKYPGDTVPSIRKGHISRRIAVSRFPDGPAGPILTPGTPRGGRARNFRASLAPCRTICKISKQSGARRASDRSRFRSNSCARVEFRPHWEDISRMGPGVRINRSLKNPVAYCTQIPALRPGSWKGTRHE